MQISDRDKKLIYIMLIAMIILLPYFFFIKDKRVETDDIKATNEDLQKEYDELTAMKTQCLAEDWEGQTVAMTQEVKDIVNEFPADIDQSNYTMFLLNTEYSSVTATGDLEYPIWIKGIAYGDNVTSDISSEDADTGYKAISNESGLVFEVAGNDLMDIEDAQHKSYNTLKYMMRYILDYKDPMTITSMDLEFDENTGNIAGEFNLMQFAVVGGEDKDGNPRVLKPLAIDPAIETWYGRGNEEVGVFGPRKITRIVDPEDLTKGDDAGSDDSGDEE